jgi:hypothetical protein
LAAALRAADWFSFKKGQKQNTPNCRKKEERNRKNTGGYFSGFANLGGFISFSGNSAFSEGLYAISSL